MLNMLKFIKKKPRLSKELRTKFKNYSGIYIRLRNNGYNIRRLKIPSTRTCKTFKVYKPTIYYMLGQNRDAMKLIDEKVLKPNVSPSLKGSIARALNLK